MTLTVPSPVGAVVGRRRRELDALRGTAVLCMVADHLALFLDAPDVRWTVGRVAMPLFFVLGGHLALRLAWRRYLEVAAVGVGLQLAAPWSGAGPLLLTFVAGAALVVLARRHTAVLAGIAAVGLGVGANGVGVVVDGAYDPRCLLGLMALGALLPSAAFTFAARWPAWLAAIGRRPLLWYGGHVLALAALFTW